MSGERANHALARLLLVLAVGAETLSWLWALFLYSESWRDRHGYNQLGALVLTSALHWAVCLPLAVGWLAGALGPWLPRLTYAAPLMHLAGSRIDTPGCWPFFVIPPVVLLVVGACEVRSGGSCGRGPRTAPDAEPTTAPDRVA